MIKVLIADDHQIVVDGLVSLLKKQENIEVVATANNGKEVIDYISINPVDIAVLDINMPEMDGVETTSFITNSFPNTKVLILSMYDTDDYIGELLDAGCSGYILKNKGQEELVKALVRISQGEHYYGEKVLQRILDVRKNSKKKITQLPITLTSREKDVLKLIARGLTASQIAKELCIEETTVNTHSRNMRSKLSIKNINGLVRYAMENGLAD
jgi:two-component system nitrate/nitrite response regulator NarL